MNEVVDTTYIMSHNTDKYSGCDSEVSPLSDNASAGNYSLNSRRNKKVL